MKKLTLTTASATNLTTTNTNELIDQLHNLGFVDAHNDGVGNVVVLENRYETLAGTMRTYIVLSLAPTGRTLTVSAGGRVIYTRWLRTMDEVRAAINETIDTEVTYLRAERSGN